MSTTALALNEKPRVNKPVSNSQSSLSAANESQSISDLKSLGKNDKITVNKVDTTSHNDDLSELNDEFMNAEDSEFNTTTTKSTKIPAAGNTTTITVSTSPSNPVVSASGNSPAAASPAASSPAAASPAVSSPAVSSPAASSNLNIKDKNESVTELNLENDLDDEKINTETLHDNTTDDDEKSAAELVAAAAAQIANKSLKKPITTKPTAKTIKNTGKMLESGNQEKIMKKAMLMLNESGHINVVTEEPTTSIIKLNTPANKAQIKLKSFRQNFEKHLAEMRRKSPLEIQKIKTELANIEFAEIGNKNIITGLLELVDDQELKLLTIEKMLKHGDITLNF